MDNTLKLKQELDIREMMRNPLTCRCLKHRPKADIITICLLREAMYNEKQQANEDIYILKRKEQFYIQQLENKDKVIADFITNSKTGMENLLAKVNLENTNLKKKLEEKTLLYKKLYGAIALLKIGLSSAIYRSEEVNKLKEEIHRVILRFDKVWNSRK